MQEKCFDIERLFFIKKIYEKAIRKISAHDKLMGSYAIFAEAILSKEFHSQQELSDFVGCNKAHTSRTLLKMQLKGILSPIKKDAPLQLTPYGREFAENMMKDKHQFICKLFENIPKNEVDTFVNVLNQVFANAEAFEDKI